MYRVSRRLAFASTVVALSCIIQTDHAFGQRVASRRCGQQVITTGAPTARPTNMEETSRHEIATVLRMPAKLRSGDLSLDVSRWQEYLRTRSVRFQLPDSAKGTRGAIPVSWSDVCIQQCDEQQAPCYEYCDTLPWSMRSDCYYACFWENENCYCGCGISGYCH